MALFDIKYILKASTDVLCVSNSEFKIHITRWRLWHSDFTKFSFGWGAPHPAGGAYNALLDPLVGWGEGYLKT